MNLDILKDTKSKLTSNMIPNKSEFYKRHVCDVIQANTTY